MPALCYVIVLLVAFVIGARFGEEGFRAVGFAFEAIGVLLVLWRLARVREMLGNPVAPRLRRTWRRLRAWLRRRGGAGTKSIEGVGGIVLGGIGAAGYGTVRPPENADTDTKLDALWRAVGNINERIGNVEKRSADQLNAAREALLAEIERREAALRDELARLRSVASGDQFDVWGVVFITTGLTLATFAQYFAAWTS